MQTQTTTNNSATNSNTKTYRHWPYAFTVQLYASAQALQLAHRYAASAGFTAAQALLCNTVQANAQATHSVLVRTAAHVPATPVPATPVCTGKYNAAYVAAYNAAYTNALLGYASTPARGLVTVVPLPVLPTQLPLHASAQALPINAPWQPHTFTVQLNASARAKRLAHARAHKAGVYTVGSTYRQAYNAAYTQALCAYASKPQQQLAVAAPLPVNPPNYISTWQPC